MKTKLILVVIILQMQIISVWSQGNLLIAPTRVLITKVNQTEQISLLNTGNDSAIYSINFVNKKMNEDGGFITLAEGDTGALFSSDYVRVFPRKVALGPKEGQTIKVQFKKRGRGAYVGVYGGRFAAGSPRSNRAGLARGPDSWT